MMREFSDQPQQPRRTALRVRGLSKWFGTEQVLDDISFSIDEGESLAILGHSGSGKTTTLRIIAGLEAPDTGEIMLGGRRIEHLPARERNIGVIFQNYALFPRMTVTENICFGLRIRGVGRDERQRVAAGMLALTGLSDQCDKYPAQLSGGQQQRVAIARALAYQPALLLFDESFSALDPQTRGGLRREIRALLRQLRVPALFITHDQEEAMELGDQIAILSHGRIEQIGPPAEVYHHPRTEFVATFLGAANILAGVMVDGQIFIAGQEPPVTSTGSRIGAGERVRLLFRPEDGVVTDPTEQVEVLLSLGEGVISEVGFAGAIEWLTIELGGRRQGAPPAATIRISRTRWEADRARLSAGQTVAIGLRRHQLLE